MKKKIIVFIVLIGILAVFSLFGIKTKETSFGLATLSWDVNQGPGVAGYKIYYGNTARSGDCPSNSGYPYNVDVGNNTSYTINDLETNKTYYFSITSYNASGMESCFSQEVSKKVIPNEVTLYKKIFKNLKESNINNLINNTIDNII